MLFYVPPPKGRGRARFNWEYRNPSPNRRCPVHFDALLMDNLSNCDFRDEHFHRPLTDNRNVLCVEPHVITYAFSPQCMLKSFLHIVGLHLLHFYVTNKISSLMVIGHRC